jgi:hypothetical protein
MELVASQRITLPFVTSVIMLKLCNCLPAMHTNRSVIHSLLFLLVFHLSAAQSNFVHSISASGGVSFPVGNFSHDFSGKGHGFADPGFTAQVLGNIGPGNERLNYLAGITAIINPLDEKAMVAMWPPGVTIQSKNYKLFGISGGAVFDLAKSERVTWKLKGTLGIATISYPAHEMRFVRGDGVSSLVYRSSADNSINLNGSLGSTVQCRVSPRVWVGGELDFFRTRAHHLITYVQGPYAYPPTYQEDLRQQIAIINIKLAASYSL